MKILYDHQCYWEKYGGVSRYFTELIKRIPTENRLLTVKFSNNEYIKEISNINYHNIFPSLQFKGKARLIGEIGKFFSLPIIKRGSYDIYHPTHYDCYGINCLPSHVKTVATIHDMNFFVIPESYPKFLLNKVNQEKMANSVDHIITISQNTKKDIKKFWNIPDERISVIYHGIDKDWVNNVSNISYYDSYFLFVGRRSQYKNFELTLKSFLLLKKKYNAVKLYCAGNSFSSYEKDLIKKLGLEKDIIQIQASNKELINLYRHAIGFIFPSKYEGFGLPILEAMAAQCPCILSNSSCFPEIAGDAALYFEGEDVEDLSDKMEKLILDNHLRRSFILKGNLRVADFSWEKCTTQHMVVYKNLL